MIPTGLHSELKTYFGADIAEVTPVYGGDINRAARISLADGQMVFAKWHASPPPGMFPAEAHGLQLLAQANALRVPAVFFFSETYLVMEWLGRGEARSADAAQMLGAGLAEQHRYTRENYGLPENNYCGLTPQLNTPVADWVTFFGENRLGAQMDLAAQKGNLPAGRAKMLEKLIARLGDFLPANPPASLLHGDLWGGNWLVAATGEPALIDPAVYFGDREADLAFTELFGGFPPAFYRAYHASWALDAGYNERKDLYNLYHLLNHLNLFGESYGSQVEAVLKKYL